MWRLIKQFPKFLLVFVVLVGSTFWFRWWWTHRTSARAVPAPLPPNAFAEKAPDLVSRIGRLLVANGDLYDVDTGEVLARKWIKGESPFRFWFDSVSGKII